ncbi:MAG TPA: L,D-transpeptidase [Gaiellaceae bacterium]|nr:L,D-transpeptidase [Gaiellaceae bacterium]
MRRRSLIGLLLGLVALSGCGTSGAKHGAAATAPQTQKPVGGVAARTCVAGSFHRYLSRRIAYAAIVRSHAVAVRRPGGRVLARFGSVNQNGVPMVFGVLGARLDGACAPTWYRVHLPMRPNGIKGWVPASEVTIASVNTRIDVDLSKRRLTLYRDGRPILTATVAVGSPATPTPTGRFYVNQRLIPDDKNGPYGPAAIGISAFSNVLTGWTQGGPVAIHGTDEPSSIGHAVSNGCIRLPNRLVPRVFAQALAGTPVTVHP